MRNYIKLELFSCLNIVMIGTRTSSLVAKITKRPRRLTLDALYICFYIIGC
ncbi:hypothetical protein HanRHA438_Chr01g0036441 [Helianthus annuus]|nr:hypothetical protein HanRHA438_Chr01g0036441 [Helianthus annuus]